SISRMSPADALTAQIPNRVTSRWRASTNPHTRQPKPGPALPKTGRGFSGLRKEHTDDFSAVDGFRNLIRDGDRFRARPGFGKSGLTWSSNAPAILRCRPSPAFRSPDLLSSLNSQRILFHD